MREYKRLTKSKNSKSKTIADNVLDCVLRLQELEDKIESGTLIELGYHIRKSYRNHDDQRYKIILIDEVEIDKIGYDGLTKEQAEEKLKELKGKE